MKPNIQIHYVLLLCGVLLITGACATPGDYGDAPDGRPTGYRGQFAQTGQFPTLSTSGGAVAENTTVARLGSNASIEVDANDLADPDGRPNLSPANTDSDDGLVDFVVLLTSIPPPAVMTVNVTGDAGSRGQTFWINVLIDLNMDGQWGGVAGPGLVEWAVRNFPVNPIPGRTNPVRLPPFYFGNGNRLPDGAWMRIVLSDDPIAGGDWNGGGQFDVGEVEDHVIELPRIADNGDDPKVFLPEITCFPNPVLFPRNAPIGAQEPFQCRIDNLGSTAGTANYTLRAATLRDEDRVEVRDQNPPPPCVPANRQSQTALGCGPTGPIAGGPPGLTLDFTGTKKGDLPSRWAVRVQGVDPPSVVKPTGIIIGYGDSTMDIDFVEKSQEEEIEPQE